MLNRTMTLGELMAALERKDEKKEVIFDFVYFRPDGTLRSYRGDYSELSLGYTNMFEPKKQIKVGDLLAKLLDAVGKTFTGYKGGEFTMGTETPVWVANCGEAGGTGIVDVCDGGIDVVLKTAKFD